MRLPIKFQSGKIWERVSKISIFLLVFLLPIFFLPWTTNFLDFPKQTLLLFLVFTSLISWLGRSIVEGEISLNLNLFNLVLLIFLVILGLSTVFSAYRYGSFWGLPLDISSAFVTVFGFLLFYFLIVNIFQKKEIFGLLLTLIFSSFLAALFGIFQIFGKFIIPFDLTKISSFNTIGTINSFGVFSAVLLPLVLVLTIITRKMIKFLLFCFGALLLILLFVINFWLAWISLLISSALLLIFGMIRRPIFQGSWLTFSMLFLALALVFGFLKISIPGLPALPLEISPSQRATFDISFQTLKNFSPPKSLFFGSGPGTFVYDYSKFKPETLNQTNFWMNRFSSGASEMLNKLATTGILGFLSFLAILVIFFFLAIRCLNWRFKQEEVGGEDGEKEKERVRKKNSIWILSLGIFAGWLGLVFCLFFYPFNLSLSFLFWIFMANFIVLTDSKFKNWNLETPSRVAVLVSFVFIFFLILGISLLSLTGQRYLAEVKYRQGLEAVRRGDNQAGIDHFLEAISLTRGKQDNYWRDLSQAYLFRINEEIQRLDVSQEEIFQTIIPLLSNAVGSAKAATDVSSQNVANWAIRGFVYRNLIGLIGGAESWAIKSYEEAIKLEPTNPYLLTELGRVYLAKNELEKAKENFQKAIDLKLDYAPAHFQLAMVFVKEGKTQEAIEKLEATKEVASFDPGLAFQLGVIYYQENDFDKAKEQFERTVLLDPNYSNARYFLGLIYDRQNQKEKAIEQFEKISELNPDNEEVKKILANLRLGKEALEGITPARPPIEEVPPERLEE